MKKIIFLISSLVVLSAKGQVGIGNTTPKAQLDISASSITAPTASDGILIPRVTAFPAAVTADQNGMLVFLTTAFGTNKVGFYYYDFPSLSWKWMATGNNGDIWRYNNALSRIELPFQSDGATLRPVGNEAVILDNGNVGFGTLTPARHFTVNRNINAGTKFAVSNPNTGTSAFSQITAESKGNTSYLYSINDTYPFDITYPWFTAGNSLLQSTGVGGLSLAATDPSAFMNFFTGGRDESMRISAVGNLGIGTKNPLQPLHISGPSASVLLERFGIGSHFVGRTANGTQAAPTPLLANEIATRLSGNGYNGSNYWPVGTIDIMSEENQTPTTAGGFIKFQTTNSGGISSSEKMRITSNGNVGIGITNPIRNLEVSTSARFTSSNPFLELNGTYPLIPNLASFRIRSAGEIVMRSNENNASIPDWEIKYGSGTNANPNDAFYIGRRANASVSAIENFFLINSVGNVGIGTPNPTKSLVLNQKSATDGFQFTGQSIAGPSTGTGFVASLGLNSLGNKQLWLGDVDYLGLTTGGFTRYGVYNGIPRLDAVRGDGAIRTKLLLGVAGDINSGIISSNTHIDGGLGVGTVAGTAALNGTLPTGSLSVDGQIGVGVSIPNPSAIIDLTSISKGLLLPRMAKGQRDAIVSPVAGLIIYQTDNTPGLRVYNGTNWIKFSETID
jgi:hypothetical protein